MPLFVTPQDYAFMTGINREIINQIIETNVIIFSLDKSENPVNLYGENLEKIYRAGIECNALITHDDPQHADDAFGPNIFQNIICGFLRSELQEKDFYPEKGDVVKWNDSYFEISQTIDNQLIAGRVGIPHSILCTAVMVNRSSINVRQEVNNQ